MGTGATALRPHRPGAQPCRQRPQCPVVPPVVPQAYSLQHSTEDRLAYLDHLLGGELALQLLFLLYGLLALAFLSGYYVRTAAQVLAVLLPLAILLIDGNLGYWHALRRVEFWNQMKLIGQNVGIFGAVVILATDG
ncbi:PREDICTED: transmembrane protein 101 [Corvus brachyrhynchos]|uniref:transmembrane protein 101 n=1 Tax=Corvus brachyrhynchos TaxID=85066 RepID=UPI0004DE1933|nr:PREDICTED: transmembrane protein 101 [Corvus brachyrhynchos]